MPAVTEKYVSCRGFSVTLDTSAVGNIEDGGYKIEVAVDETTNLDGGGGYEDAPTVTKFSGSFKVAWPAGGTGMPTVEEGKVYPIVIDGGAGNRYLGGNVRITSTDNPVLNVKAAVHVNYSWNGQGLPVTVRPGP